MAWTETSENGYTVLEETGLTLTDTAGATIEYLCFGSVIDTGLYPGWQNAKFPISVQVTTAAGGACVLDAILQVSHGSATTGDVPGTADSLSPLWADGATADLGATALANAAASHTGVCDATDLYSPYARIAVLNSTTVDAVDSNGRVTVRVAIPGASGSGGAELATIGGIGADPS
jgi:hypothetical protein|tara:strand:+ start:59 stop:586 length:528 start_codon:yes stop_codon:yes gene_type:complete